MVVLRHTLVACLTLALALVAGCRSKQPSNPRQQSPLTPVAQDIQRRGYHAKESRTVPPTPWEISTFRMRSKGFVSFRADQPQGVSGNYYCRFSLFEETYD